jgi:hypothetical protein
VVKTVKKSKLFTAGLTDKDNKRLKGYTHAYSFKQAMRNLGITHPKDRIEWVQDEVTGLKFTRQEWLQIARREKDN